MATIEPFTPVILRHPRLPLSVNILPYGLTVHRILFADPTTGETHDLITGPEDPKDHQSQGRCFFGPVVGRYANRLPKGKSELPAGHDATIDLPEWGGEGICHHGGPDNTTSEDALPSIPAGTVPPQAGPLDRIVWSRVSSSSSRLFGVESPSTPGGSSAIFAVTSPADSNGFPGALRIEARFALVLCGTPPQLSAKDPLNPQKLGRSAGTLRVEYRAHIIDSCKATPVNLTQHWGFQLGAKDAKIDDHTLRLIPYPGEPSEQPPIRLLETDSRGLPTGQLGQIPAGDAHDLAAPGEDGLGQAIATNMPQVGYDNFYVWGFPKPPPALPPSAMMQLQMPDLSRCILHSPETKLSLVFRTNQAGVQVYTANGQPPSPAPASQSGGRRKLLHSRQVSKQQQQQDDSTTTSIEDEGNAERSAVFLEFGMPHATFLYKDLIEALQDYDTILKPMENYANWVEVELWKGS